ncbi:hypothetical protein [Synechococcus sp. NOUM97013]|uniref:hypothetical protein n=1 Tax=Synechococcus sp. NOUM97013 TaxID=1442555 RepID=UPI0018619E7A|nr:hypothetical protein [Synechococcus sp. NOUM97013]QNI72358.1 N-acetylmuramoyl-L-alanine amidase [Synechococcus sp. NOUM97013]
MLEFAEEFGISASFNLLVLAERLGGWRVIAYLLSKLLPLALLPLGLSFILLVVA